MTTLHLLIVCVAALWALRICAFSFVASALGSRPAPEAPPPRVGHRVTVHTKKPDDQTIYGVLVADYPDRLVLEHAEYVTSTGARAMPGTQHVATRDIAWIDVHQLVAATSQNEALAEAARRN